MCVCVCVCVSVCVCECVCVCAYVYCERWGQPTNNVNLRHTENNMHTQNKLYLMPQQAQSLTRQQFLQQDTSELLSPQEAKITIHNSQLCMLYIHSPPLRRAAHSSDRPFIERWISFHSIRLEKSDRQRDGQLHKRRGQRPGLLGKEIGERREEESLYKWICSYNWQKYFSHFKFILFTHTFFYQICSFDICSLSL